MLRKAGEQRDVLMAGLCPPAKIGEWSLLHKENPDALASIALLLNDIGCVTPEYAAAAILYIQSLSQDIVMDMIDFMKNFLDSMMEGDESGASGLR